ncbi:MAG TPA: GNAT family N-acetyltransferase, partial [Paracoccaceae bacterium]|nr:GNAT family N-acetyltransferase [Paracoccaceae bacterium]
AELARRFDAWNRRQTDWNWATFSVALREDGRLLAAGRGIVNMGLVEIRGLWVEPALRGRGIGRRLLAAIEAEAARRGCIRAALDSYSWQAPGFYERAGWRRFAVLDYPNGTSRHWFVKELQAGYESEGK